MACDEKGGRGYAWVKLTQATDKGSEVERNEPCDTTAERAHLHLASGRRVSESHTTSLTHFDPWYRDLCCACDPKRQPQVTRTNILTVGKMRATVQIASLCFEFALTVNFLAGFLDVLRQHFLPGRNGHNLNVHILKNKNSPRNSCVLFTVGRFRPNVPKTKYLAAIWTESCASFSSGGDKRGVMLSL